jgi:hypothetical protein
MFHPDFQQLMVEQRLETLRRDARRPIRVPFAATREDLSGIALRLCRVGDDPALEQLAELEGSTVPAGRLVLAEIDGRLVAALPVAGGCMLADPFVPTAHLRRLLELRAAQLREPARHRLPLLAAVFSRVAA